MIWSRTENFASVKRCGESLVPGIEQEVQQPVQYLYIQSDTADVCMSLQWSGQDDPFIDKQTVKCPLGMAVNSQQDACISGKFDACFLLLGIVGAWYELWEIVCYELWVIVYML